MELSTKIKKAAELLETFAATTASLAPYPVASIGQVVVKKKGCKSNEAKKEHNR